MAAHSNIAQEKIPGFYTIYETTKIFNYKAKLFAHIYYNTKNKTLKFIYYFINQNL